MFRRQVDEPASLPHHDLQNLTPALVSGPSSRFWLHCDVEERALDLSEGTWFLILNYQTSDYGKSTEPLELQEPHLSNGDHNVSFARLRPDSSVIVRMKGWYPAQDTLFLHSFTQQTFAEPLLRTRH